MRGNRRRWRRVRRRRRSIPACAGEPEPAARPPPAGQVYPRVCGGTLLPLAQNHRRKGLSPRVRGNHELVLVYEAPNRSIPACAGEPARELAQNVRQEVYPRVCGGTLRRHPPARRVSGLSPRVRGNRAADATPLPCYRSIPACAGEPCRPSDTLNPSAVYPRVCGGTTSYSGSAGTTVGLSPRVRGNPVQRGHNGAGLRSIPACAGEPPAETAPSTICWVYPRVCGGTCAGNGNQISLTGLSPRVRGNRPFPAVPAPQSRSIPACAGEPHFPQSTQYHHRVYPRVCGGTVARSSMPSSLMGLSPRVRGNQQDTSRRHPYRRSIPACAGEPRRRPLPGPAPAVYPRVCGGTTGSKSLTRLRIGLSPRVRGNRPQAQADGRAQWSIPACAGEPLALSEMASLMAVYPRVCGGTSGGQFRRAIGQGLSPRVRGNQHSMPSNTP